MKQIALLDVAGFLPQLVDVRGTIGGNNLYVTADASTRTRTDHKPQHANDDGHTMHPMSHVGDDSGAEMNLG